MEFLSEPSTGSLAHRSRVAGLTWSAGSDRIGARHTKEREETRMISGDVVIVGGGIVGMATAYYLAKGGVPSIVIERDAIGSHASGFAYGGLSPLGGFGIPGPLAEIPQDGMRLHRELAASF